MRLLAVTRYSHCDRAGDYSTIVTELPTTPYLCVAVRRRRMPQKQRCMSFGTARRSAPFVQNTLVEATPAHDGNVLEAVLGQHAFRARPCVLTFLEMMQHAGAVTIRARVLKHQKQRTCARL